LHWICTEFALWCGKSANQTPIRREKIRADAIYLISDGDMDDWAAVKLLVEKQMWLNSVPIHCVGLAPKVRKKRKRRE
jgi:hypothetical protein